MDLEMFPMDWDEVTLANETPDNAPFESFFSDLDVNLHDSIWDTAFGVDQPAAFDGDLPLLEDLEFPEAFDLVQPDLQWLQDLTIPDCPDFQLLDNDLKVLDNDFKLLDNDFSLSAQYLLPDVGKDESSILDDLRPANRASGPDDNDAANQGAIGSDGFMGEIGYTTFTQSRNVEAMTTAAPSLHPKKRTVISPYQKQELAIQFSRDPYPDEELMNELSIYLELPVPAIRNWFANTRSRYCAANDAPIQEMSTANLDHFNRNSPPPDNVFINRYLATSFMEQSMVDVRMHEQFILRGRTPTPPIEIPSTRRASSQAGSVDSAGSIGSVGSVRSVDSRGSRKGRRGWSTHLPPAKRKPPARYFCTYPNCDLSFHHRFEWERHEEAVHYCPYHWICCSDQGAEENMKHCFVCDMQNMPLRHIYESHFSTCAKKPVKDRTFLRRDQFQQHIKRHLTFAGSRHLAAPDTLMKAWKCNNINFDQAALECGFCREKLSTWTERNDHVFSHFKEGVQKSHWRLDSMPQHTVETQPCLKEGSIAACALESYNGPPVKTPKLQLPEAFWIRHYLWAQRETLRITCNNCKQDFTHSPPPPPFTPSTADCTSRLCRRIDMDRDPKNLEMSPGVPYTVHCRACYFSSPARDDTLEYVLQRSAKHVLVHTESKKPLTDVGDDDFSSLVVIP